MTKTDAQSKTTRSETELAFYSGAERRISRWFLLLVPFVLAAAWVLWGTKGCFGVGMGAVLGWFNHGWLLRTTRRTSENLAQSAGNSTSSGAAGISLAFGSVARIALVTAIGYAIFRGSIQSFYGYLVGLALPIVAVCAEALYEAWYAATHSR